MVDEAELVLVADGPQGGRDAALPAQLCGRLTGSSGSSTFDDAVSFTKVQGIPIFADDLEQEILRVLGHE